MLTLSAPAVRQAPPDPVLGAAIHFPNGAAPQADWDAAEAAAARVRETFGPGAFVRWDGLWHEIWWNPGASYGYARAERALALLKRQGLRSLMEFTPHPWPGSGWDGAPTNRDWGHPLPEWFPAIADRYRRSIAWYREALAANAMPEGENAVQWGNEPASGHPGGDGTLPRGTWSAHALWYELHRGGGDLYGDLTVASPALSMLDEPVAATELATARVPEGLDWTAPVDRRAMHFRFYHPELKSPRAYADAYVAELARRAALVLAEPYPAGTGRKALNRAEGLWITEGYIASGDCPEPRAECWRLVFQRIKAGVPGVNGYFAYRFYPDTLQDGLDWSVPPDARVPIVPLRARYPHPRVLPR